MNETKLAHFQLYCVPSSILIERLLQTVRYRGFVLTNLVFNQVNEELSDVQFIVRGQAKLTTLKKSLEGLVEVQQCYLTEDKAKLATLLKVEQFNRSNISHSAQSITI